MSNKSFKLKFEYPDFGNDPVWAILDLFEYNSEAKLPLQLSIRDEPIQRLSMHMTYVDLEGNTDEVIPTKISIIEGDQEVKSWTGDVDIGKLQDMSYDALLIMFANCIKSYLDKEIT